MKHSQTERKRQERQAELDSTKSLAERNRLGQYATPFELAFDIANVANNYWPERHERIHFLDPGFGTGVFFSAINKVFPAGQIISANGIEIDSEIATVARELWEPFGVEITNGDFTTLPTHQIKQANLIICNPPYVRHHHLAPKQKKNLQEKVFQSTSLKPNGLSGFYCYFILLAHRWMMKNGLGIWLIPTEFMHVNYGKVIRQYLTTNVKLLRIHQFDPQDVQFSDALVSSAVVVFQNTLPADGDQVEVTFGGSLNSPALSNNIDCETLKSKNRWKGLEHKKIDIKDTGRPEIVLSDFFKTRRGVATGANSYFIISRTKAAELDIPIKFQKPILPSPRFLEDDIVEVNVDGFPDLEEQQVLISCDIPEEEVEKQYPALWKYFLHGKELGIHNRYLAKKRSPWYKQEDVKPAPFLVTYMGRKNAKLTPFRFIWNKSLAIAPNTYHLIYPLPHLSAYIGASPERQIDIYELFKQIAVDDLIRGGRTYGGGLHKIEPRELQNIRLDNIDIANELFANIMLV